MTTVNNLILRCWAVPTGACLGAQEILIVLVFASLGPISKVCI